MKLCIEDFAGAEWAELVLQDGETVAEVTRDRFCGSFLADDGSVQEARRALILTSRGRYIPVLVNITLVGKTIRMLVGFDKNAVVRY